MGTVGLIPGTVLSFIDRLSHSWPTEQTSAVSESVNFELTPPQPLLASAARHTHKLSASTHKPDRPSPLHAPRPDMQFISWKTCRKAKGGRAFYLVLLQQLLLSMLYLGSFHPPANRRVYMSPSVKDLRLSHPESNHLKGELILTGPTRWSYDAPSLCKCTTSYKQLLQPCFKC